VGAACAPPPEVCREGQEPSLTPATARGAAGFHPYAHSHNDYEHRRPLEDALDARFYSVEADVYFRDGRFEVSHLGFGSVGTLEALYLAPLQARVDARGSVHGDGLPLTLWVDLKDKDARLPQELAALLARFPMVATFDDRGGVARAGAVRVVLTGEREMKEAFTQQVPAPRPAVRDSNDYTPGDPAPGSGAGAAGWGAYALNWGKYLTWNGSGELPAEERRRIACIVENAHAAGRTVRFFAAPDRQEVWQAMLDAGVDYVHTDKLGELEAFLAERR
jgi:hypothetical protein